MKVKIETTTRATIVLENCFEISLLKVLLNVGYEIGNDSIKRRLSHDILIRNGLDTNALEARQLCDFANNLLEEIK